MSEIIYLKDIISNKTNTKKKIKKNVSRPRLKPPKYEKMLKASLIEKEKPIRQ
jgi:hypothetical protein